MRSVVILLGAPGSGKGTQAVRLAQATGLPHVSTGDLFRANIGQATELGARAKGYMDRGELVPDELVLDMLFDRVAAEDCARGFVLDGFPRTLPQAEALQAGLGQDRCQAIHLEVADEVLIERAAGRLICRSCGAVHHRGFAPPKVEGTCDHCGSQALYRRDDDAPEVVRERLRVYQAETAPLVGYYQGLGLLTTVDGDQPPDDVYRQIEGAVLNGAQGGRG